MTKFMTVRQNGIELFRNHLNDLVKLSHIVKNFHGQCDGSELVDAIWDVRFRLFRRVYPDITMSQVQDLFPDDKDLEWIRKI